MKNNDSIYKSKYELFLRNIYKSIEIEIMFHYLKPDERRALYYLLCEDMGADVFKRFQNMGEIIAAYKAAYKDEKSIFDIEYSIEIFTKCKILNIDFNKKITSNTYLNLNDKYQYCVYSFTKVLYRNIYSDICNTDFSTIKENYYNYDKLITDKLFNSMEKENTYFNLIYIQGIIAEIKEGILVLKSANVSIVNVVLLSEMYKLLAALNKEKEIYIQDRVSDKVTEYITKLIEEVEEKKSKAIAKFKEDEFKLKEKLLLYEDKLKFYQKNNNEILLNNIYKEIRKKDFDLEKAINEIKKEDDSSANRLVELYNKIELLHKENEKLLLKNSEMELTNLNLKAQLSLIEKDYLISDIRDFIDKNGKDKIVKFMYNSLYSETNTDQNVQESITASYKIGYATLTNRGIEIVTNQGNYPLNNIPEKTMVGEGQLVRVDSNNNFVNNYKYFTRHKIIFDSSKKLGEIKYINTKPYIDFYNNSMVPVINNEDLSEGQIVLAETNGNIKIFFKRIQFSMDLFYEIIKFRGMELWRVINILDNISIIENIETKKQEVFHITENRTLKMNDLVLLKEKNLINIFDFRFYSFSRYYLNKIHGLAEVSEEIIMLVKNNGEKCITKNPYNIQGIRTGDFISTDEYYNIICVDKLIENEEKQIVKNRNIIRVSNKFRVKGLKINKSVLIIGNPAYQQSYLLNLLKNGYQSVLIDGYSSWSRIQKSLKNMDAIVVIVNYVSHDNMWAIKENVKDIPVIYPESDGANRIIEMLKELTAGETIVDLR